MRIIYFLLVVLFMASCLQNNKIPSGVLSQQKMRIILWDMIRADEYANNFLATNSSLVINDEKANLYEQIFRLHSTKANIFKKSLTFYQSNPKLLKVIIDSLRSDEQRVLKEQYKIDIPIIDTLIPEKLKIKPALVN